MTITLITVCYNSRTVIRTAMESVLRQTWPDIEYWMIDGGSTDGTVDVIREYEPKFNGRMHWVSEKDRGMYDAINKGIRMATGEVVGILNADDVLAADDVIERVAGAFGECGNDGVRGDNKAIRHSGNKAMFPLGQLDAIYGDIRFVANRSGADVDALRGEPTVRYYSARHWRPWMLQWGFMPPHPSVYIRRSCFEKWGHYGLDYSIAADYALLVRFLRKAKLQSRYVPLCFVDMRMGGKSTKSWRSNWVLNCEIVRGNREAGYFCCMPMLVPKYAFKIWEFIGPRFLTARTEKRSNANPEASESR
jgi:glycosyltransferase involved in cell wall biosynthesis